MADASGAFPLLGFGGASSLAFFLPHDTPATLPVTPDAEAVQLTSHSDEDDNGEASLPTPPPPQTAASSPHPVTAYFVSGPPLRLPHEVYCGPSNLTPLGSDTERLAKRSAVFRLLARDSSGMQAWDPTGLEGSTLRGYLRQRFPEGAEGPSRDTALAQLLLKSLPVAEDAMASVREGGGGAAAAAGAARSCLQLLPPGCEHLIPNPDALGCGTAWLTLHLKALLLRRRELAAEAHLQLGIFADATATTTTTTTRPDPAIAVEGSSFTTLLPQGAAGGKPSRGVGIGTIIHLPDGLLDAAASELGGVARRSGEEGSQQEGDGCSDSAAAAAPACGTPLEESGSEGFLVVEGGAPESPGEGAGGSPGGAEAEQEGAEEASGSSRPYPIHTAVGVLCAASPWMTPSVLLEVAERLVGSPGMAERLLAGTPPAGDDAAGSSRHAAETQMLFTALHKVVADTLRRKGSAPGAGADDVHRVFPDGIASALLKHSPPGGAAAEVACSVLAARYLAERGEAQGAARQLPAVWQEALLQAFPRHPGAVAPVFNQAVRVAVTTPGGAEQRVCEVGEEAGLSNPILLADAPTEGGFAALRAREEGSTGCHVSAWASPLMAHIASEAERLTPLAGGGSNGSDFTPGAASCARGVAYAVRCAEGGLPGGPPGDFWPLLSKFFVEFLGGSGQDAERIAEALLGAQGSTATDRLRHIVACLLEAASRHAVAEWGRGGEEGRDAFQVDNAAMLSAMGFWVRHVFSHIAGASAAESAEASRRAAAPPSGGQKAAQGSAATSTTNTSTLHTTMPMLDAVLPLISNKSLFLSCFVTPGCGIAPSDLRHTLLCAVTALPHNRSGTAFTLSLLGAAAAASQQGGSDSDSASGGCVTLDHFKPLLAGLGVGGSAEMPTASEVEVAPVEPPAALHQGGSTGGRKAVLKKIVKKGQAPQQPSDPPPQQRKVASHPSDGAALFGTLFTHLLLLPAVERLVREAAQQHAAASPDTPPPEAEGCAVEGAVGGAAQDTASAPAPQGQDDEAQDGGKGEQGDAAAGAAPAPVAAKKKRKKPAKGGGASAGSAVEEVLWEAVRHPTGLLLSMSGLLSFDLQGLGSPARLAGHIAELCIGMEGRQTRQKHAFCNAIAQNTSNEALAYLVLTRSSFPTGGPQGGASTCLQQRLTQGVEQGASLPPLQPLLWGYLYEAASVCPVGSAGSAVGFVAASLQGVVGSLGEAQDAVEAARKAKAAGASGGGKKKGGGAQQQQHHHHHSHPDTDTLQERVETLAAVLDISPAMFPPDLTFALAQRAAEGEGGTSNPTSSTPSTAEGFTATFEALGAIAWEIYVRRFANPQAMLEEDPGLNSFAFAPAALREIGEWAANGKEGLALMSDAASSASESSSRGGYPKGDSRFEGLMACPGLAAMALAAEACPPRIAFAAAGNLIQASPVKTMHLVSRCVRRISPTSPAVGRGVLPHAVVRKACGYCFVPADEAPSPHAIHATDVMLFYLKSELGGGVEDASSDFFEDEFLSSILVKITGEFSGVLQSLGKYGTCKLPEWHTPASVRSAILSCVSLTLQQESSREALRIPSDPKFYKKVLKLAALPQPQGPAPAATPLDPDTCCLLQILASLCSSASDGKEVSRLSDLLLPTFISALACCETPQAGEVTRACLSAILSLGFRCAAGKSILLNGRAELAPLLSHYRGGGGVCTEVQRGQIETLFEEFDVQHAKEEAQRLQHEAEEAERLRLQMEEEQRLAEEREKQGVADMEERERKEAAQRKLEAEVQAKMEAERRASEEIERKRREKEAEALRQAQREEKERQKKEDESRRVRDKERAEREKVMAQTRDTLTRLSSVGVPLAKARLAMRECQGHDIDVMLEWIVQTSGDEIVQEQVEQVASSSSAGQIQSIQITGTGTVRNIVKAPVAQPKPVNTRIAPPVEKAVMQAAEDDDDDDYEDFWVMEPDLTKNLQPIDLEVAAEGDACDTAENEQFFASAENEEDEENRQLVMNPHVQVDYRKRFGDRMDAYSKAHPLHADRKAMPPWHRELAYVLDLLDFTQNQRCHFSDMKFFLQKNLGVRGFNHLGYQNVRDYLHMAQSKGVIKLSSEAGKELVSLTRFGKRYHEKYWESSSSIKVRKPIEEAARLQRKELRKQHAAEARKRALDALLQMNAQDDEEEAVDVDELVIPDWALDADIEDEVEDARREMTPEEIERAKERAMEARIARLKRIIREMENKGKPVMKKKKPSKQPAQPAQPTISAAELAARNREGAELRQRQRREAEEANRKLQVEADRIKKRAEKKRQQEGQKFFTPGMKLAAWCIGIMLAFGCILYLG